MTVLVLDASVALSWFLPGEHSEEGQSVRQLIEDGAVVLTPCIWGLEIANALLTAERRRRISQADSTAAWNALGQLPIETDEQGVQRAGSNILAVARQCRLSVYDAAYLELAMRRGATLASLDQQLRAAAQTLQVALLPATLASR